jgi:hypothetical protein
MTAGNPDDIRAVSNPIWEDVGPGFDDYLVVGTTPHPR